MILIHLSNLTGLDEEYSARTMGLLTSDQGTICFGVTAALSRNGVVKVSPTLAAAQGSIPLHVSVLAWMPGVTFCVNYGGAGHYISHCSLFWCEHFLLCVTGKFAVHLQFVESIFHCKNRTAASLRTKYEFAGARYTLSPTTRSPRGCVGGLCATSLPCSSVPGSCSRCFSWLAPRVLPTLPGPDLPLDTQLRISCPRISGE